MTAAWKAPLGSGLRPRVVRKIQRGETPSNAELGLDPMTCSICGRIVGDDDTICDGCRDLSNTGESPEGDNLCDPNERGKTCPERRDVFKIRRVFR